MFDNKKYIQYRLLYQLVNEKSYDVLYMSESNQGEVWLKKEINRKSVSIIHIVLQGFHWKNHLKNDVMNVFQKGKTLQNIYRGKNITISQIYMADYQPVDYWDMLKKPIYLKKPHSIQMHLYYLGKENYTEEMQRISSDLAINPIVLQDVPDKEQQLNEINKIQQALWSQVHKNIQQEKEVLSYGRFISTYFIIMINVLIFIVMTVNGGTTNPNNLIAFGAKYNPAIINDGEWWRLISSIFIHIGFFHLFMNMLALFYLGNVVERIYGSTRFLLIYFLSGISGGLASFAFTANVSAGASGAIFGLFGAILYFGLHYRKLFMKTIGYNILFLIALNILIGFLVPTIDNAAHLGGLFGGLLASIIVQLPYRKNSYARLISLLLYVGLAVCLSFYGIAIFTSTSSF